MNWRKYKHERKMMCIRDSCKMWVNEEKVETLNIEEGMQGEDKLTFRCPDCGQKSISRRYG